MQHVTSSDMQGKQELKLPQRNLVAFHSMIDAYNLNGRVEEALCLFFSTLIVRIFVWVIFFFFKYGMDIIIGTGLEEIQD